MALAVVQSQHVIHGIGVPGSVTLTSTPTAGNLIIMYVGCNIGLTSITLNTTDWELFAQQGNSIYTGGFANVNCTVQFRYVQPGDTASLPNMWTAGSTWWGHVVYEISGVSGDWKKDLAFCMCRANDIYANPLPAYPILQTGLALTMLGSYNGSVDPTISGSWTRDEHGANNALYGSVGGAHRAVSAGDTIDGQWTTNSNPSAGVVILLTDAPQPRPFPRNVSIFAVDSATAGHPTTPTMTFKPRAGNLLVLYLGWNPINTTTNPTVDTSNWTTFITQNGTSTGATNNMRLGLYRYVQTGDTATLPNITTAGNSEYSIQVLEIGGVSGNWALDHIGSISGYQDNHSPFVMGSQSTRGADQFAWVSYGELNTTIAAGVPSGWIEGLEEAINSSVYGATFCYVKFFPASGSTVSGTITPGVGNKDQCYIQSIFGQGLAPPPQDVVFTKADRAVMQSKSKALTSRRYDSDISALLGTTSFTPPPYFWSPLT